VLITQNHDRKERAINFKTLNNTPEKNFMVSCQFSAAAALNADCRGFCNHFLIGQSIIRKNISRHFGRVRQTVMRKPNANKNKTRAKE
jgi:hypothetical protein